MQSPLIDDLNWIEKHNPTNTLLFSGLWLNNRRTEERSFNLLISVAYTKANQSTLQWQRYSLFRVPCIQRHNFNVMSHLLINASYTQRFKLRLRAKLIKEYCLKCEKYVHIVSFFL